jgi:hypothetical protein
MFIAPVFYGKQGFDEFWAPFLWKSIGIIRVKAI